MRHDQIRALRGVDRHHFLRLTRKASFMNGASSRYDLDDGRHLIRWLSVRVRGHPGARKSLHGFEAGIRRACRLLGSLVVAEGSKLQAENQHRTNEQSTR